MLLGSDEVTSTPFSATVEDGSPYCFQSFASQDVRVSVRITHIAYVPPASTEELAGFVAPPSSSTQMMYAVAEVEDITLDNKLQRTVVGCFPLDLRRLKAPEACLSFQYGYAALAPVATDVVKGINILLDCDGSVSLFMKGPGKVVFYGEQFSALIPEWKNHRIFTVGDDDEEQVESDLSEGEISDMLRHSRS